MVTMLILCLLMEYTSVSYISLVHTIPLLTYLILPSDGKHMNIDTRRERKKHNGPGDTQKYQSEEIENVGIFLPYLTPLTPKTTHSLLL